MTNNSTLLKSGLVMLAALAFNLGANATTYTATGSGSFSAAGTWSGNMAPPANLTTADNILIAATANVTLDEDIIINNATASLEVEGTLSGSGHSVNVISGSLTGGLTGSLTVKNLTLGASSTATFLGSTTADNLYNSQSALSLAGATKVNDTLGLYSGITQLGTGITLTLTSGANIVMNGGTYSSLGGGNISLLGNVNLIYSGAGSATAGGELGLTAINNVTVNLSSNSNQVSLGGNLTVSGQLSLKSGSLNLNGHNLILNGTIDGSGTGTFTGSSTSDLVLGGSAGSMGTLAFTSGSNTIHNLTINGSASGYANLATDLNVAGQLTLTSGGLNLTGSSNLTLTGTDSIAGGSSTSYVATSGTGSLVVNVAGGASLDNSRMLHIGTASGYAPVRVTNSSATSGSFSGNAHAGIFANGTTGSDLSSTMSSVNTSWNVESSITTGANVSLEAYWNASAEVNSFNTASVYLAHYTNSAWDLTTGVQATAHAGGMLSVKRDSISSFSPFAVFSNGTNGISEVSNAAAFTTYPNPANNSLTVSLVNPKSSNELKVYDVLGNKVGEYTVTGAKNTIDITNLTAGVYFLSVNNAHTQKFVKN